MVFFFRNPESNQLSMMIEEIFNPISKTLWVAIRNNCWPQPSFTFFIVFLILKMLCFLQSNKIFLVIQKQMIFERYYFLSIVDLFKTIASENQKLEEKLLDSCFVPSQTTIKQGGLQVLKLLAILFNKFDQCKFFVMDNITEEQSTIFINNFQKLLAHNSVKNIKIHALCSFSLTNSQISCKNPSIKKQNEKLPNMIIFGKDNHDRINIRRAFCAFATIPENETKNHIVMTCCHQEEANAKKEGWNTYFYDSISLENILLGFIFHAQFEAAVRPKIFSIESITIDVVRTEDIYYEEENLSLNPDTTAIHKVTDPNMEGWVVQTWIEGCEDSMKIKIFENLFTLHFLQTIGVKTISFFVAENLKFYKQSYKKESRQFNFLNYLADQNVNVHTNKSNLPVMGIGQLLAVSLFLGKPSILENLTIDPKNGYIGLIFDDSNEFESQNHGIWVGKSRRNVFFRDLKKLDQDLLLVTLDILCNLKIQILLQNYKKAFPFFIEIEQKLLQSQIILRDFFNELQEKDILINEIFVKNESIWTQKLISKSPVEIDHSSEDKILTNDIIQKVNHNFQVPLLEDDTHGGSGEISSDTFEKEESKKHIPEKTHHKFLLEEDQPTFTIAEDQDYYKIYQLAKKKNDFEEESVLNSLKRQNFSEDEGRCKFIIDLKIIDVQVQKNNFIFSKKIETSQFLSYQQFINVHSKKIWTGRTTIEAIGMQRYGEIIKEAFILRLYSLLGVKALNVCISPQKLILSQDEEELFGQNISNIQSDRLHILFEEYQDYEIPGLELLKSYRTASKTEIFTWKNTKVFGLGSLVAVSELLCDFFPFGHLGQCVGLVKCNSNFEVLKIAADQPWIINTKKKTYSDFQLHPSNLNENDAIEYIDKVHEISTIPDDKFTGLIAAIAKYLQAYNEDITYASNLILKRKFDIMQTAIKLQKKLEDNRALQEESSKYLVDSLNDISIQYRDNIKQRDSLKLSLRNRPESNLEYKKLKGNACSLRSRAGHMFEKITLKAISEQPNKFLNFLSYFNEDFKKNVGAIVGKATILNLNVEYDLQKFITSDAKNSVIILYGESGFGPDIIIKVFTFVIIITIKTTFRKEVEKYEFLVNILQSDPNLFLYENDFRNFCAKKILERKNLAQIYEKIESITNITEAEIRNYYSIYPFKNENFKKKPKFKQIIQYLRDLSSKKKLIRIGLITSENEIKPLVAKNFMVVHGLEFLGQHLSDSNSTLTTLNKIYNFIPFSNEQQVEGFTSCKDLLATQTQIQQFPRHESPNKQHNFGFNIFEEIQRNYWKVYCYFMRPDDLSEKQQRPGVEVFTNYLEQWESFLSKKVLSKLKILHGPPSEGPQLYFRYGNTFMHIYTEGNLIHQIVEGNMKLWKYSKEFRAFTEEKLRESSNSLINIVDKIESQIGEWAKEFNKIKLHIAEHSSILQAMYVKTMKKKKVQIIRLFILDDNEFKSNENLITVLLQSELGNIVSQSKFNALLF